MTSKNNKNANKRKPIEIYFILYLVALVILISTDNEGTNKKDINTNFNETEFPFRIKSEKPLLVCKIITDTNGNKQYQLDSINYILDYGNVKDIQYEFTIEDVDLKQKILLKNDENVNQIFSYKYDEKNRVAIFRWYPNIENTANKTLNVYVNATAIISNKNDNTTQKIQAKTQFSLVITNDYLFDNKYELVTSNNNTTNNTPFVSSHNYQTELSSDFSIKPQIQTIRKIAGDTWENEIICYGFNPRTDLLMPPIIEINNSPLNNGGSIISDSLRNNSILLRGKVPDAGKSRISINVQRKDLKEQKIYFDIQPISIQLPNVPSEMYPNREYYISPNIPNDISDIASYIKEKENDKVLFRSFNNDLIKFKPSTDDIGKILTFERYCNDKLIGQKHQIKIIDFPPPEITRLSERKKDELILETISFGTYKNKDNTIREVRIIGNAKYTQQHGKTHINRTNLEIIEQFSITPKDNSKPFSFTISVIDQRGRESNKKTK